MKAILIDDEPLALQYLEYQLRLIGGIEITGKFTDALEGMAAAEQREADVVFLDVHMPELNGRCNSVRRKRRNCFSICFTTAASRSTNRC